MKGKSKRRRARVVMRMSTRVNPRKAKRRVRRNDAATLSAARSHDRQMLAAASKMSKAAAKMDVAASKATKKRKARKPSNGSVSYSVSLPMLAAALAKAKKSTTKSRKAKTSRKARSTTTMAKKKGAKKKKARKVRATKRPAWLKGAVIANPRRRRRRRVKAQSNPVRRRKARRRPTRALVLKVNPPRRRRRKARRNPVRVHEGRGPVRTGRYRRKSGRFFKVGSRPLVLQAPFRPGSKRKSYIQIRRAVTKSKKRGLKHYVARPVVVRRNPGAALKQMLLSGGGTFIGLLGMRALNYHMGKLIVDKLTGSTTATTSTTSTTSTAGYGFGADAGIMTKLAPVIPAALGLVAAAFAGKFIKGQPAVVQGLQTGATIAFFDVAFGALLKAVGQDSKLAYLAPGLSGGYGEYLPLPVSDYGEYLPQQAQSPMGAEVQEALAEYVQNPMSGMDVEEALAADEVDQLQRGYASGGFAHTVFST